MNHVDQSNASIGQPQGVKKAHGQTGPKSLAGKNRSRWNALKDGATAKSSVLPFESEKLYRRHIKEVEMALQPCNYVEAQLAREYAEGLWRITRHEKRGAYERERILEKVTPPMIAQMLDLEERYIAGAPYYLTNLKYKISAKESAGAKKAFDQYCHLMENAKGIANFHLVWGQYQFLFEALGQWLIAKDPHATPLINSLGTGINLPWQHNAQALLKLLEKFSIHLFFVANFENFKPSIRVWIEAWFFAQKTEMRRLEQDDQILLKERNHVYSLLDRIVRIRKSNTYLVSAPSTLGVLGKSDQEGNVKNEMQ